jgi:hypothetical protein
MRTHSTTAATTTMDAAASTAMDGTTSADASTRAGATAIHMGRAAASPVPCRRVMPRTSATACRPRLRVLPSAAAIAEVRMLARPIAEIGATAAGIENPLTIAAAEIQALLSPAAITEPVLDMGAAIPIVADIARPIDGDVVVAPVDIAAPIAA